MMKEIMEYLSDYNCIIKESASIYHGIAKSLGVSDSIFWILYTIRETKEGITQRDMININYFPPQTINSALKRMELDGLVELHSLEDKRKKRIFLTDKGRALAGQTADRVLSIEADTMAALSLEEREAFLALFQKYTQLLKNNLSVLNKEKQSK